MSPPRYSPTPCLAAGFFALFAATTLHAQSRGPLDRTIYDDWIAEIRAKRDTAAKQKEWDRKLSQSGYPDHSKDLAELNEQSRIRKMWAEAEARDAAYRAAREAERARAEAVRKEELRKWLAVYDEADAGDADALMTLGKREEGSAYDQRGIPRYQMVFGPRRKEALWRIVTLMRSPAGKDIDRGRFRSPESFLKELADTGDNRAAREFADEALLKNEYEDAVAYYARAGQGGDAASRSAVIRLLAEDRADAAPLPPEVLGQWCDDAAAKGDRAARYLRGRSLARGEDAPANPERGFALLKAAAEPAGGLSPELQEIRRRAAELAGLMLRDGVGVKADPETGIAWLESAANDGDLAATSRLGETLFLGIGTEADPGAAKKWLSEAAYRDDAKAATLLARMLLADDSRLAQSEGLSHLKNASKRNPDAAILYGKILYDGAYGVERDPDGALALFTLAFRRYGDDPGVLDFVGASYLEGGYGIRQKPAEGVRLLTLAYERGSLRSARRLADAYRAGTGVAADPDEAKRWNDRVR